MEALAVRRRRPEAADERGAGADHRSASACSRRDAAAVGELDDHRRAAVEAADDEVDVGVVLEFHLDEAGADAVDGRFDAAAARSVFARHTRWLLVDQRADGRRADVV
jgi:hypothetical protein